jgi:hypothetical protein
MKSAYIIIKCELWLHLPPFKSLILRWRIKSFLYGGNLYIHVVWPALKRRISTYKRWIKSWTIYANTWIGILVGWRIRSSVDAGTRQSRVARQCQARWIVLTWANRLSWYRIVHNGSTIFAASWCRTRSTAIRASSADRSRSVRWSVSRGVLRCLRKGTGRKWTWLSASIWTQRRRWISLR